MKVFKAIPFKQVKLPSRLFKVKLKEIKDFEHAKGSALQLRFTILDAKFKGVTAGLTLWLYDDEDGRPRVSEKGEDIIRKLSGKDEMESVDPYDFIGEKYSALIKQEKSKKDGKIYNNVTEILPYDTDEEPEADDEEEETPKKKHKDDDEEDEPKKKHVEDDEDEDEPKKKHKSDDDEDDEDEKPAKKNKDDDEDEEADDEDDEDDKPAKKDKDEDFDE